jgi:hypothetical protein
VRNRGKRREWVRGRQRKIIRERKKRDKER